MWHKSLFFIKKNLFHFYLSVLIYLIFFLISKYLWNVLTSTFIWFYLILVFIFIFILNSPSQFLFSLTTLYWHLFFKFWWMIIFNFLFLDLDGNYSEGQIQGLTSASLLRSESFHTNHLKDINNNNNNNNNDNLRSWFFWLLFTLLDWFDKKLW